MFFSLFLLQAQFTQATEVFRYAIPTEPHTLDPTESVGVDSQHLLGSIFRGLYSIDENGGLISEGARSCRWKDALILECQLKKTQFSDGSELTSEHYLQSFRHFLRPESKTTEVELLMKLRNASEYHTGKLGAESLGIKAPKPYTLIFEFSSPDPEFEYKLAFPLLFPWKKIPTLNDVSQLPVNGPYKITNWEKGKLITLAPNPHYKEGHALRPLLEVRFIADESTLMNMFDAGRLDFIRRIPTLSLERYRKHKGFLARPLSRFDYLGFGPKLRDNSKLREALTQSLNYEEFQKLFNSFGRPGCPSFPESYVDRPRCYSYQLKQSSGPFSIEPLRFLINESGGSDLRRGAEWFQNQWKKNLGVNTKIESVEGKFMLSEVRSNTPDLFRLSVPLTRPTCLAAVELFQSESENNLVKIKDPSLDDIIVRLGSSKSKRQKQKLCGHALDRILGQHRLIPLGRFQFFMVVSERFTGLRMNELNHLNLSQLRPAKIPN